MDNFVKSAQGCVGGAVNGTTAAAKTSGGAIKGGLATTKAVANKAKELGQGALQQTMKSLGAAAAFQSVFGENIDKSDSGLTTAFNKVDVDSSGKISVKEMTAYIASVYGGYAACTAPTTA